TLIVFSSVAVALSGGFILLWCYGQPWFLDVEVFGTNLRDVFRVHPIKLSSAVWIGFIALFGIATDDGVLLATYIRRSLHKTAPTGREAIQQAVLAGGRLRIRACLMTTATTLLALLPVLSSYGTGADVMIPMSIPLAGGMAIELFTLFVVPTLMCSVAELEVWRRQVTLRWRRAGVSAPQS
ncbi:MAG: efflux RND transporter permease subunit, partial [Myxococcales bacterium]|nr:efflux RND transporter permease subunit [Myxococcales bacterium]